MALHFFELSTVPVCDVCGSGAPRLLPLLDPSWQPLAACPSCAPRVARSLARFDPQRSPVAARARQVLRAMAPV